MEVLELKSSPPAHVRIDVAASYSSANNSQFRDPAIIVGNPVCELEEKISKIFSDFMSRFAKLEGTVEKGNKFLVGFCQGLEFLRRPPINKTSELIKKIIKENGSKRLESYVQTECINTHDRVQNMTKLHTCQCGLQDHIDEAKFIIDGLECLVEDATAAMQTANEDFLVFRNKEFGDEIDQQVASLDINMESVSSSCCEKPQATDYAVMMSLIYCMLKQDYVMQEKIVSSLNLNSSSGELESYRLMWSLRPYVNDEMVHRLWKLIP